MSQQGQNNGATLPADTTYTKIFVGGLAWSTRVEGLTNYFQRFGEIIEASVILERHTGRSKGYGFVTFREPQSAASACLNKTQVIDGRQINCNLAYLYARGNNNNQVHQNGALVPAVLRPQAPEFVPFSHVHQPYALYSDPYAHWYPQYIPQQFPMEYYNPQIYGMQQHMLYMNPYLFYGHNEFNQNGHFMQGLYVPQQHQPMIEGVAADDNAEASGSGAQADRQ